MDGFGPGGPGFGFGGFWHVIAAIFFGVGQFLALLVFLGVLFLFVRFLIVGTRAAHVYIAKNAPAAPPAAAAPAAARPATTAARPAPAATAPTAPTKPAAATRPTTTTRRTPKPPAAT
jgi:hypothetical protein